MACFQQWDVGKWDVGKGLKGACALDLALSCSLGSFGTLTVWRSRGLPSGGWETPQLISSTCWQPSHLHPWWPIQPSINIQTCVHVSLSVVSNSLWSRGPAGLLRPWGSPGKNTGVGSHSLFQGIFPTHVTHTAGGFFTNWATRETQEYWRSSLSLLQGIFLTQESNRGLLHCTWILY